MVRNKGGSRENHEITTGIRRKTMKAIIDNKIMQKSQAISDIPQFKNQPIGCITTTECVLIMTAGHTSKKHHIWQKLSV